MFDLKSIRPTRRPMPPRLLFFGPHKIGKSTLAAGAPSPIFIPTEDGQDQIESKAFPLCRSWADVLAAVATLYTEPHDYQTVVLDSVDWAEQLAQKAVCAEWKETSIEKVDKGYGHGYTYAADKMRELLEGLNALREKRGMAVILLAHAEIKNFNDPMSEAYDRYQIKCAKAVGKLIQEWSDAIGFCHLQTFTKTEEQGFGKERVRAVTARRVVSFEPSASYDAGSRYGLKEMDLNFAAIAAAMQEKK